MTNGTTSNGTSNGTGVAFMRKGSPEVIESHLDGHEQAEKETSSFCFGDSSAVDDDPNSGDVRASTSSGNGNGRWARTSAF